jgi:hypothetical protein
MPRSLVAAVVALAGLVVGCRSGAAPAPATATPAPSGSGRDIALIDTTVVIKDCPESSKLDPAVLDRTLRKFVEGCSSVPGGSTLLSATLAPNGRIELGAPDGMVPACMLKNPLVHQLPLKLACRTEVRVEEKKSAR